MSVDFERARKHLGSELERRDRQDTERLLRERARALASIRLAPPDRRVLTEAIVIRRERSTFAFPTRSVTEVRSVRVTRIPHATRYHSGLFHLRGRVHSLVDLQPFVGAGAELRHGERTLAIVVESGPRALGVRADEILGPRTIYEDELDESQRERKIEFIRFVTRTCEEIIDVDALFESPLIRMENHYAR